jgi:soluble lytic murein transglycosylase-like protein
MRLFRIFLTAFPAVFFSCAGPAPANLPESAPQFLEALRNGNTEALRSVNLAAADLRPYIHRRPGAAYYLACGLEDLGMNREAGVLLEKTFLHDIDPWRMSAGGKLAERLGAGKDGDAMSFALQYNELYPGDFRSQLIMMKALFVSGAYMDLLARAERFTARPEGLPFEALAGALLYRAQAEYRLNHPRFPQTLRRLFSSCPASAVHAQAWALIAADESAGKFFARDELEFFKAKPRRAAGEWEGVLNAYKKQSLRSANDPVFLREYADILQRAAGWREGIKELESILPALDRDARLICEEYLGKFYRLGGQYEKSVSSFQNALAALGERADIFPAAADEAGAANRETQKDRIIWYLLSSSLRLSAGAMIDRLPAYLPVIEDPEYFSDLFESLASGLVRARDWDRLVCVYSLLRAHTYEKETGRYAFLLASAIKNKLYTPAPGSLPAVRELFEYAFARAEPYYRILAGLALKKDLPGAEVFFLPAPGEDSAARADSGADKYVRGFLDFGLGSRALRAAKLTQHSLSPQTILLVAESEAAQGRYIDSLRLLQRASRRPGVTPDRRMLEALYPQAYSEEMFQVIAGAQLPPALFYGLVREESYFDADIGSHAGAVGLAQLMPSTALEVAAKLKIPAPQLTDPLTNLRIGAFYLAAQWKRFGDGAAALAAYNAGTNRAARWRRQLSGLPEVLFTEALSLPETREYIRKVLVAAVHYGYLYHNLTARRTVREIFKDFS